MPDLTANVIKCAEYDPATRQLTPWLPEGRPCRSCQVPARIWQDVVGASSRGRSFSSKIDGGYPCEPGFTVSKKIPASPDFPLPRGPTERNQNAPAGQVADATSGASASAVLRTDGEADPACRSGKLATQARLSRFAKILPRRSRRHLQRCVKQKGPEGVETLRRAVLAIR